MALAWTLQWQIFGHLIYPALRLRPAASGAFCPRALVAHEPSISPSHRTKSPTASMSLVGGVRAKGVSSFCATPGNTTYVCESGGVVLMRHGV